jgi:hypothetical protein
MATVLPVACASTAAMAGAAVVASRMMLNGKIFIGGRNSVYIVKARVS